MKKRRITLNLDEDIVEALESQGGRSLSAAANASLREAIEKEAHRVALLQWLEKLNATYGAPTAEDLADADALLDELENGTSGGASAA